MRISAKADYAVRAALELAAATDLPVKGERIAAAQGIPPKFLESIMVDLRQAGLVASQRGPEGGYRLDLPPERISIADVIRAVDGPLAVVHGDRPDAMSYHGVAAGLEEVWVALRANVREVLEEVSLADVVEGSLPPVVRELAAKPDAWTRH